MDGFSSKERLVARVLTRYPKLKRVIKLAYQIANYILHKRESVILNPLVSLHEINKKGISFFGYFDKSPERNGNYIYHNMPEIKKARTLESIDICVNSKIISSTTSWNWQQGSMLSWLNNQEIIHNTFNENKFRAKIINMETSSERTINYPIYNISNSGSFAISLNFSRLARLRPDYGYFNLSTKNIDKYDIEDGVIYIDLINDTQKLIISFEDLVGHEYRDEMHDAWHKVNHIDISPDCNRFMFMHRWYNNRGQKFTRLLTANIDGSQMHTLADDEMVSHCTWKNNSEIIGWLRKEQYGDHYYLLKDKTQNFEIIGEELLREDGHPSISKDERWLLTDTYPNKSRLSKLLLFDMQKSELHLLGEFYSKIFWKEENRCDLHPRFNEDNSRITFDSIHEGKRRLYELEISKIINAKTKNAIN